MGIIIADNKYRLLKSLMEKPFKAALNDVVCCRLFVVRRVLEN
jgi:hypothetical protein